MTTRSRHWSGVALVLGLLCMAPTAGDVGGCGTEPTALDVDVFAVARKEQDCERCGDCGIGTARCRRACDLAASPDISVPATCRPLHHDGQVCLRALHAASCDSYATYVADIAPATPSECEFCKFVASAPPPATTSFADASTVGTRP